METLINNYLSLIHIYYPRFGYRGFMVYVGRHYFPVSYLKQIIAPAGDSKEVEVTLTISPAVAVRCV